MPTCRPSDPISSGADAHAIQPAVSDAGLTAIKEPFSVSASRRHWDDHDAGFGVGGPMKRYEVLAADIEQSIGRGVLRCGDRLPSVRSTSRSRGISASTVFAAYYLLEARGVIRARERSGYYVAATSRRLPLEAE